MRNGILFRLLLLMILLLPGCSFNKEEASAFTVESNNLNDSSLEKLFLESLGKAKKKQQIANIQMKEVHIIDNLHILTFIFDQDDELHHGIFLAYRLTDGQYEFGDIETAERVGRESISYFNYSGEKKGKVDQNLHIISGYINDRKVDEISITYSDGKTSALRRAGEETFTEINIGSEAKPERIQALASNNEIIFEQEYAK